MYCTAVADDCLYVTEMSSGDASSSLVATEVEDGLNTRQIVCIRQGTQSKSWYLVLGSRLSHLISCLHCNL
jgi:hypothetical protein